VSNEMSAAITPRKTPCASCPYRENVPSGIWAEEEYDKLEKYDLPTDEQPFQCFACHQEDGHLCSGWLAYGDPQNLLSLRIGVAMGRVDPSAMNYSTSVPLFASGREASEHGKRDLIHPGPEALALGDKIVIRRKL
jgi:hypothetical protein